MLRRSPLHAGVKARKPQASICQDSWDLQFPNLLRAGARRKFVDRPGIPLWSAGGFAKFHISVLEYFCVPTEEGIVWGRLVGKERRGHGSLIDLKQRHGAVQARRRSCAPAGYSRREHAVVAIVENRQPELARGVRGSERRRMLGPE